MRLEKFIYNILQSPFKSFLVYLITLILFILKGKYTTTLKTTEFRFILIIKI